MLISSRRDGDYLKALKWALTGTEVLVVSADGRNCDLIQILDCFDPIFCTGNTFEAGYFTAKLFPFVEVLMDDEPFKEQKEVVPNFASIIGKITEGVQNGTLISDDDRDGSEIDNESKVKATSVDENEKHETRDCESSIDSCK